jgi:hypothetical protein
LVSVGTEPGLTGSSDRSQEENMSFKIKSGNQETEAQTAAEAVAKLDEVRGEPVVVEVDPETDTPEEVTASQRVIEERQVRE